MVNNLKKMVSFCKEFSELSEQDFISAGGKGGMLAKLYQLKYPVPPGLIVFPESFNSDGLRPDAWEEVKIKLKHFKKLKGVSNFAVRSSALSEDSDLASFAGEFETVLNVESLTEIWDAIGVVFTSRLSARVQTYSREKGIDKEHQIAVVIQKMVPAEVSGVLFTADPISADRSLMVGNYTRGLGEKLVSGDVNPDVFHLTKPKGEYKGPAEMAKMGKKLFKLAVKIELQLAFPQDIEWAVANNSLFILQSRPISTLKSYNPITGEWNDSMGARYLWTSNNTGEGMEDIVLPFSWSYMQKSFIDLVRIIPGIAPIGNICGRLYFNISYMLTMFKIMGKDPEKAAEEFSEMLGKVPKGMSMPTLPYSKLTLIKMLAKNAKSIKKNKAKATKNYSINFPLVPKICAGFFEKIPQLDTKDKLKDFWLEEFFPWALKIRWMMLGPSSKSMEHTSKLRTKLKKIVGEENATILISNLSSDTELLDSMGPIVGLSRVIKGTLSRQEYLYNYGHRSAHEGDISTPRPIEDPKWLDKQLAEFKRSNIDVEKMMEDQKQRYQSVLKQFQTEFPKIAKKMHKDLLQIASNSRMREKMRSESVRFGFVLRKFALKVGEITGLGEDLFYLTIDEMLEILSGNESSLQYIPARKKTHAKYNALHPYPVYICGKFDPEAWHSNPQRRTDFYSDEDEIGSISNGVEYMSKRSHLTGFSGSSGVGEGRVRVLNGVEEGDTFQPGEILVAKSTNIGWTLLFPRAAAIITDIGAPLSHASIVARELGIPAVVGTNDATIELNTGDFVKVNGTLGIVEIIARA
ncbi:hypothetical protein NEF87_001080 [Candidatus Lokiarchaeum ossiferum]|uniref:Phosphoenolpyruvate synthase n=1 Tax=Candidatus Lokiarchaeum ossiferum TaxID=2951803 RepID=A0ABY6HN19_9ARCH|nr:hypothetical protein NEF87_001080 [Candidatus Lokiarchaeum sp. B-35]